MLRTGIALLSLALGVVAFAPPAAAVDPHDAGLGWLLGRGRIGIRMQPLTPELRDHFGAPSDRGVLVSDVEADRPAARAGLAVGDVVTAVDGEPVTTPSFLAREVRRAPSGKKLSLTVIRDGEEQQIDVVPDDPEPLLDDQAFEWVDRFGRHLGEGGRHFERRLRELEKRMEELQRDLEERLRELEGSARKT